MTSMSVLEARLKQIRAAQAFKEKYPNATFQQVTAFTLGYQAALNDNKS